MKTGKLFGYAVAVLLLPLAASATIFTQGQNVNLLTSPQATITATYGPNGGTANALRGSYWNVYNFDAPDTSNNTFTYDLGQTRNVKSIRVFDNDTWGFILGGTVEYFDGSNWQPAPSTYSRSTSTNYVAFTLNNSVNAQQVRLTVNDFSDAGHRLLMARMGVFGETASMYSGTGLNIAANDGYTGPNAVTFNQTGGSLGGDSFVTDQITTAGNRVWYNVSQGDKAWFTWNQTVTLDKIGISTDQNAGQFDGNMGWSIWGSTDGGSTWSQQLLTHTGLTTGVQYFDVTRFTGNALKFQVDTAAGNSRFGGFFVYEAIPEPSTVLLLVLGGLVAWQRSRRS